MTAYIKWPLGSLIRVTKSLRSPTMSYAKYLSTSIARYEGSGVQDKHHVDIEDLLSKPTWSVSNLLPPKGGANEATSISSQQLHHLLRLSALPPPKDDQEEAEMLNTLASQLHFVKEIQQVDTTGVEPFRSLRDETAEGEKDAELGLAALQGALDLEDVIGKHHKRIRRRRTGKDAVPQQWDALDTAERKVGRYFVIEGGRDR